MRGDRPLIATDRAAIMLQLVPYLIGKGEVSIAEAADHFGWSRPNTKIKAFRARHRLRKLLIRHSYTLD